MSSKAATHELNPAVSQSIIRYSSASDAVFAVAITLLVLNLKVPEIAANMVQRQLPQALASLGPQIFAYTASFFIIGIFWAGHHDLFRAVIKENAGLFWLNLLFLFCIVTLPFSTSLFSTYPNNQLAFIIYNANLAATAATTGLLWFYVSRRHKLINPAISTLLINYINLKNVTITAVFLLTIGLSYVMSPGNARWTWSLVIILQLAFGFVYRRRYAKITGPATS
jgi:uncharacterized membrane protein